MWGPIIAAGISTAGNLAGGLMGSNNDAYDAQKEFAQHAIRWRVKDAQKAGVNPLYALGMNATSFAPLGNENSMGNALAQSGADIGNAIYRTLDKPEKSQSDAQLQQLQLENAQLNNDFIRQQILSSRAAMFRDMKMPDAPSLTGGNTVPGQGNAPIGGKRAPLIREEPAAVTPMRQPGMESSGNPSISWVQDANGGWYRAPSEKLADRDLDMSGIGAEFMVRNKLVPYVKGHLGDPGSPPDVPLKPGHTWVYNKFTGTWYQSTHAPVWEGTIGR